MKIRFNPYKHLSITDGNLNIDPLVIARTARKFETDSVWVAIGQAGEVILYQNPPTMAVFEHAMDTWINYAEQSAIGIGWIEWSENDINNQKWRTTLYEIKN